MTETFYDVMRRQGISRRSFLQLSAASAGAALAGCGGSSGSPGDAGGGGGDVVDVAVVGGGISGLAAAFFFRQSNPTMFDLTTGKRSPVTTSTRPGCWINIIPAGGLILIPESSSGCTCEYSVQTTLALRPLPQLPAKETP